ncbi:MAG: STAS domain-containing protein [Gammaproteobacteria bacterium]|nr:STAS domain-containing protein [Gammaproteobacteria bacterium]NIR82290.1 STAS domain-containing protein [Gammaproteobacteria bacterium]NIR91221.1 STAS domain-containing protein [Gammaproteobacteria bacterium]NIU03439.1 STAS domain-containing protein [Gammaproteobacteria bacterium]NIX84714.1 STAS domain-containing protein [Gammaproteobacteria bacterium]
MTETTLRASADGVFVVCGPLTFDSTPALWQEGARVLEGVNALVLDLQDVTRTDSAGLALLVAWMREARRRGVDIRFRHIPEQLMAIARTCNLQKLLPPE